MTRDRSGTARRTAFVLGTACGFLIALGAVVANDLRGNVLPDAGASTAAGIDAPPSEIHLSGSLPPGVEVRLDGRTATVQPRGDGHAVPWTGRERRLTVSNSLGILWTADLRAGADTLRPELGGEVVVELQRQAAGGRLLLDGADVGTAPGTISPVPAGWHVIAVEVDQRIQFEDAVRVRPGEVSVVSIPPAPPRGKGRLRIASRLLLEHGYTATAGDAVQIDGESAGESPLELTLPAGFHSVGVHREGYAPLVEVLYLPAGQTRHVNADFGREDVLHVAVTAPETLPAGRPAAIPVSVDASGETVTLTAGSLQLVRPGQADPVEVPLVPSGTDPRLWVAVIPQGLLRTDVPLTGYATCIDASERAGASEIFTIAVR